MIGRSECQECQAGMRKALEARIGWTCATHGSDSVDVQSMLNTITTLRQERDDARAACFEVLVDIRRAHKNNVVWPSTQRQLRTVLGFETSTQEQP